MILIADDWNFSAVSQFSKVGPNFYLTLKCLMDVDITHFGALQTSMPNDRLSVHLFAFFVLFLSFCFNLHGSLYVSVGSVGR